MTKASSHTEREPKKTLTTIRDAKKKKKVTTELQLWVSIGAVVGCVLTALCGEPDNATQIVAIVSAVVSAVGYVLGEASVDRAAVNVILEDFE